MTAKDAVGYKLVPDSLQLEQVTIEASEGNHLAALYRELDARSVDIIRLPEGIDLWVDDEGLLTADPQINVFMEYLIGALTNLRLTQRLVGNGIFLSNDGNGKTVSLSAKQRAIIIKAKTLATKWFAEHRDIYMVGAETLEPTEPSFTFVPFTDEDDEPDPDFEGEN